MKYGISLLPECTPDKRSAATYFDDVLRLSQLGEEVGLDYVKMTEHYLHPAGGYCPSPLIFLAAVAARNRRIRLMTGGIQASFHNPIQLAAETAQVDAMSQGRLDVGFARAFLPHEFDAFGVDINTSRERFRVTVDTVIRLWSEQNISVYTPFFSFENATSLPRPIQQPHPPVWICALMSESSFRWAGERGFNLLMTSSPQPERIPLVRELVDVYRSAFQKHHGAPSRRPQVAVSLPLIAADTDEEAMDIAKPFVQHHMDVWRDATKPLLTNESSDYAGYSDAVGKAFSASVEEHAKMFVIGSPETIARRIEELHEGLSVDVILWLLDAGCQHYKTMERSLRLFEKALALTSN